MDAMTTPAPVVVVGGGLAGLTVACYLARSGVAVTLFERATRVGGAAVTQNKDGYLFNRGLHALYTGGATSAVLRELGISYGYGIPRHVWALQRDRLHPFPANPLALLRTFLLPPQAKVELVRLMLALPQQDPAAYANTSTHDWIAQTLRQPATRRLITALARTLLYTAALDIVSAEVLIARLQQTLRSPTHYPHNGWQSLVDGLRRVAIQAGVRIETDSEVRTVVELDGRVQGVCLHNGKVLPAAAVVVAVPPADALRLLAPATAPALHRRVPQFVPARVAAFDVALARLPNPRYPVVQDVDGPRFLSTQSVYARIAPPHGALVGTLKQLDARQPRDPDENRRDLEALLDTVQAGWREVLLHRVWLPHITATHALPLATNGGFAGRTPITVSGVANLYLAGDWVGGEGFLADASFASARAVAQHILHQPLAVRAEQYNQEAIQYDAR